MIKLSVIIPIYNAEIYIETCLLSLFEQSLLESEFEVILINDGSTDQSDSVIKTFAKKHSNIKIIEQTNQGVAIARNKGIQLASGKYILFTDADDFISPNTLSTLLSEAIKNNVDILRGNYQYIDENNVVKNKKTTRITSALCHKILDHTIFYRQICNHEFFSCLLLIKAEFLKKSKVIFKPQMSFLEDVLFTTELILHRPRTMYIPISFYNYRQHQTSAVATLNEHKLLNVVELISKLRSYQQNPKLPIKLQNDIQYYSNYFLRFLLISLSTPEIYEKRFAIILALSDIKPIFTPSNQFLYFSCKLLCSFNYNAIYLLYKLRTLKRTLLK